MLSPTKFGTCTLKYITRVVAVMFILQSTEVMKRRVISC